MGGVDWHKCRFLESSENLKPLVQRRFDSEPSTSIAREIAVCLQQGRLFYEAAASSPSEIRPLQMFYGMVGFSTGSCNSPSRPLTFYIALFLLSSLVRYRPQTWVHALSRSVISETPCDDQALSLIERFFDLDSSAIPEMVVTILNPHEDRFA